MSWWQRLFGRTAAVDAEPPHAVDARNPALEAELARDPDAVEPYTIYADWLEQHGDPRGALMSMQAQLAVAGTANPHGPASMWPPWRTFAPPGLAASSAELVARTPELTGPLGDNDRVEWHCGFWRRLRFDGDPDRDARMMRLLRVLAHPSARYLRELSIGSAYGDELATLLPDVLPATLRGFYLGDFIYPDESELSWTTVGDVGALYARAPQLEHLVLQGAGIGLGERIALPRLRTLELITTGLPSEALAAIAASQLPELETLIVWTGDAQGGGSVTLAGLDAFAATLVAPKLRHLGIVNCDAGDALVDVVLRAPWLAQLRVLDLSKGTLMMAAVDALEAARDRLANLERLDVSENLFADEDVSRVTQLARTVVADHQRYGDYEGDRYPAITE